MKCPRFDQVDVVLCEDGETLIAYAYPNAGDEGLVVVILDATGGA